MEVSRLWCPSVPSHWRLESLMWTRPFWSWCRYWLLTKLGAFDSEITIWLASCYPWVRPGSTQESWICSIFAEHVIKKMIFKLHLERFLIIISKMFAVEEQPGTRCDVLKRTWSKLVVKGPRKKKENKLLSQLCSYSGLGGCFEVLHCSNDNLWASIV